MHWHGFEDTIDNDGMPGISQPPVKPGERFVYEFTSIRQYFLLPLAHGDAGDGRNARAFIMHPKEPYRRTATRIF